MTHDTEQLRALSEKATGGKWSRKDWHPWIRTDKPREDGGNIICDDPNVKEDGVGSDQFEDDADFIIACVDYVRTHVLSASPPAPVGDVQETAEGLKHHAERIDRLLSNTSWRPDRSHIEQARVAIREAARLLSAPAPVVDGYMTALREAEKDLVVCQWNASAAAMTDKRWEGVSQALQPTIDRIRAALASAPSAPVEGGWRSVKDNPPPKDGTQIDVWVEGEFPRRVTDVSWREPTDSEYWVNGSSEPDGQAGGTFGADAGWFVNDGYTYRLQGDEEPTHWMPRPAPPSEPTGA